MPLWKIRGGSNDRARGVALVQPPGLLQLKEIGEAKSLAGKGNCIIKDVEKSNAFLQIVLTISRGMLRLRLVYWS